MMRRFRCVACGLLFAMAFALMLPVAPGKAQERAAACRPMEEDGALASLRVRVNYDLRAGKYDDALTRVNAELAKEPDGAEFHELLGEVWYRQGQLREAGGAFNDALRLDGCDAPAHFYAWRFNGLEGKDEDAGWKQLELAHQLAPEDAAIERTWERVQRARALAASGLAVQGLSSPVKEFFGKKVGCVGIPVMGASVVDGDALLLACGKVETMLAHADKVRAELVKHGAELHVIGERQGTSDLPENGRFKQQAYVDAEGASMTMDARTRGVGGLESSCGEENLLGLASDRYLNGGDVCTHEFAHTVMEYGLSSGQRKEIETQYRASLAAGLWKGAYAAVNAGEYWAEISMWYFGSHGQEVSPGVPAVGRDGLQAYDAGAWGLAQRLYGDAGR